MKKVIFICLLSLSVCLSKPSDPAPQTPQGNPGQSQGNVAPTESKDQSPKPNQTPPAHADNPTAHADNPTAHVDNPPAHVDNPPTPLNPSSPPQNQPSSATVKNAETHEDKTVTPAPAGDAKNNDSKKKITTPTDPPKGKDENQVKPTDDHKNTADKATTDKTAGKVTTKPDEKDDKDKTPPKSEAVTKATTVTPGPKEQVVLARGFDGASFIGGIILTLGLLAIGFMGFKYYKNQTERNYHTL